MDCLFCKIAAKQIPSTVVYEDDRVLAFNDINPQAPVHVLIIPKQHIAVHAETSEETAPLIGHMNLVAAKIAAEKGIAESGYRAVFNCNRHGGQEVYHIHLHLLGGRQMHWPPG
jgi:histidine triad (HIT) family protein